MILHPFGVWEWVLELQNASRYFGTEVVIAVQVLGKYLTIEYLDPQGKTKPASSSTLWFRLQGSKLRKLTLKPKT